MGLIQYLRVLRRWAWLIILCPLVAALAAGLISMQLAKVYEAKVSVLVRPAQPLTVDPSSGQALTPDQILRTYASWMVKPPILQKVILDVGLHTDASTLSKRISVTPEPNTTILDVSVQDTDPALAASTANTLVDDFIAAVKQVQQAETSAPTASSKDNLVVVAPAVQPTQPVSPRPLLNIGLAIAIALFVGVGVAFLLEYMDQSVRSDEILRERVGLVSLGHISYTPARSERRGELVALGGNSPVAEAYKALRTNLLFSSVDREIKTIVVTSALPSEGKSRTAANLAIVLAQAGHPTLLIDADFRRPSIHRIFGRVRNVGLSNLILQDGPDSTVFVQDDLVKNLVILPSGPTPPNPSELLGSGQLKGILDKFRKRFSFVLIDTPPVNSVTDASVLAASTDGTIVVVDTNNATYAAVQRAKESLERVGAKVLGSVMNKMKATAGNYYYYEYGYGYQSPNGKAPIASALAPVKAPPASAAASDSAHASGEAGGEVSEVGN